MSSSSSPSFTLNDTKDDFVLPEPLGLSSQDVNNNTTNSPSSSSSPSNSPPNSQYRWWWRKRRSLQGGGGGGSPPRSPPRMTAAAALSLDRNKDDDKALISSPQDNPTTSSSLLTTSRAIFLCSILLSMSFWFFGTNRDAYLLVVFLLISVAISIIAHKQTFFALSSGDGKGGVSNTGSATAGGNDATGQGDISSSSSPGAGGITRSTTTPLNDLTGRRGHHRHHRREFSLPSFFSSWSIRSLSAPVAPDSDHNSQTLAADAASGESLALLSTSNGDGHDAITDTAGNDISIPVRMLIKVHLGMLPSSEAVKTLTGMEGQRLFDVRDACDQLLRLPPYNSSFYDMVFSASVITDSDRHTILTHFGRQVLIVCEKVDVDDVEAAARRHRPLMILSDIDDTLFPTFKDRRGYSWGSTYPGVKSLYRELLLNRDPSISGKDWTFSIAFVTARPAFLSTWTLRELRGAGFPTPLVLMGTTTSTVTPKSMLNRKLEGCRNLRALYPERDFVLVGDNGQKDIDLGILLLSESLVSHVAVHDIFKAQGFGAPVLRVKNNNNDDSCLSLDGMDLESCNTIKRPSTSTSLELVDGQEQSQDEHPAAAVSTVKTKASSRPLGIERGSSSSSLTGGRGGSGGGVPSRSLFVEQHGTPIGYRNEECSRFGISLFQTYVGAGVAFHEKGFITLDALERVVHSTAEEMNKTGGHGAMVLRDAFLRDTARVATFMDSEAQKIALWKRVHLHV